MRIPFLRRQPAQPPRHLIAGLGNPGAEYHNTRHNVGFRVVDRLAEENRIQTGQVERRSLVGYGTLRDVGVVLAKPQTFMNLSGESIAPLARTLQLRPEDIIVITDDMDLPVGRIRVRPAGSAGGHNGLKSLIQHLGTDAFPRVRVGVGRPAQGSRNIDHVLGKFGRDEIEPLRAAMDRAVEAVEVIVVEGVEAAMNRFNRKEDAGSDA